MAAYIHERPAELWVLNGGHFSLVLRCLIRETRGVFGNTRLQCFLLTSFKELHTEYSHFR